MNKRTGVLAGAFLGITFLTWAYAQNTQCATRAPGDNTNACASTAFVTQAIINNITGPGSAVVGQIATWANTAATQLAAKFGYTKSILYAADYGVIADGTTNNNTTLQAAIDACNTFPATGKGCILQLSCGNIKVSTTFTINYGMIIQGCGPGRTALAYDIGGTVITQSCTTCNTFLATTLDAVVFRDFGLDGPLTSTAGSWIYVRPEAVPVAGPNQHSSIVNVRTRGGWTVFTCELCGNYYLANNLFAEFNGHGVDLFDSPFLTDIGDATIIGNTIAGSPTSQNCILIRPAGLKITSNKLIQCNYGIHILAQSLNPTGTSGGTEIESNNIELMGTSHILIEQGTPGISYGLVIISNNHMQAGSTVFQGAIVINAGTAAPFLNYVVITGNLINIGQAGALVPAVCMAIRDGNYVLVTSNFCNSNNAVLYNGISVSARATSVSLLDNIVANTVGGVFQYEILVPTLLRDLYGIAFANLPANLTNGSQVFVTNADPASAPCTTGGASTGSTAFRQNGAWKCF
jgi:hypothetical protein